MSKVVPFDVPSRAELWERLRIVESILNHRVIVPASTRQDLLRAVRGELVAVPGSGEAG